MECQPIGFWFSEPLNSDDLEFGGSIEDCPNESRNLLDDETKNNFLKRVNPISDSFDFSQNRGFL